jgi:DNA-binding response OmpR family regulator
MPRILTVDDSNTIRTIITKQMSELGFDIEQAEDGEQGLAKLEEISVDLILLDVTMPVMDGPTMLAQLRERGNKTPVIMLTSESKRAIVSGALKLGIEDYILKPFKPDELRAKVLKALKAEGGAASTPIAPDVPAIKPAPATAPASAAAAGRQFTDVLIVDDMDNVHKKLRQLLPAHVSMTGCVSAREAIQHCQERVFRVILVDTVIPDVNSVALMNQLRVLQPHAVMVALALRTANDATAEAKAQGFQDALCKPFDPEALDDFLSKHFDVKELLTVDGNVLACAGFEGKEDKLDRFFTRLKTLCRESLEKLASACFEASILDMSNLPVRNDKLVRLVVDTDKEAKKLGISLSLVGNAEMKKVMSSITETATLRFFGTLSEARAEA